MGERPLLCLHVSWWIYVSLRIRWKMGRKLSLTSCQFLVSTPPKTSTFEYNPDNAVSNFIQMWMFLVELTPKIGKTSMTTSDPFSMVSVKIQMSTVRHISTTTDTLPTSWDEFHFNIQIQSVFHPKVGIFLTILTFL